MAYRPMTELEMAANCAAAILDCLASVFAREGSESLAAEVRKQGRELARAVVESRHS